MATVITSLKDFFCNFIRMYSNWLTPWILQQTNALRLYKFRRFKMWIACVCQKKKKIHKGFLCFLKIFLKQFVGKKTCKHYPIQFQQIWMDILNSKTTRNLRLPQFVQNNTYILQQEEKVISRVNLRWMLRHPHSWFHAKKKKICTPHRLPLFECYTNIWFGRRLHTKTVYNHKFHIWAMII